MIKLPFNLSTVLAFVCLVGISNCDICDLCKGTTRQTGPFVSAEVSDKPGGGVLPAR